MARMPDIGYLTMKQYQILSGEINSMSGGGEKGKNIPKVLRVLFEVGWVESIVSRSGKWWWKVTERGRSEAGISLQEANRRERLAERERQNDRD